MPNISGVPRRPVILLILDGFGVNPSKRNNAVAEARTPNLDAYFARYPHTLLRASGAAVGLPDGQMGNSEVGHLTLGAGDVIRQDIVRINETIASGDFFANSALCEAADYAAGTGRPLHLIGLVSDGGVHSHLEHLYALLRLCRQRGARPLLHMITDGRDTPPHSALDYLLEPTGMNWEQFKEKGWLKGEMVYQKYKERGFSTPTGKFELYSTVLEKWGYDPLPKYTELPESPVSKPELLDRYPYILNAGLRTPTFFHSANRNIPWLREIRPDPIVEIHPDTAKKHGIEEGDWVLIESPRGGARERAKLNDGIDPRVIVAEHGWWYPEIKEHGHGWNISNINMLTDNAHETMDPAIGATNLRTCLCSIRRVEKPDK
mgnify:CR=1 FL=1